MFLFADFCRVKQFQVCPGCQFFQDGFAAFCDTFRFPGILDFLNKADQTGKNLTVRVLCVRVRGCKFVCVCRLD